MIQHTFTKSIAAAFGCLAVLSGCMKWDDGNEETAVTSPKEGTTLFIACEGQYQYGNASLSWYDTGSRTVENDVFRRANGQKLGDVAQSMTLENGTLWITVTNSNVVFATDPATCKLKGQIAEGLSQPREIRFISEEKAYVSQMNDPRIAIVNPSRFSVTGYIDTGMDNADGCSTEQMILMGTDLIVNCYSCQKEILIIDTRTDEGVLSKLRSQGQKPVTTEEGMALARKLNSVKYIECAAKTTENMKMVFDEAIKAVLFKKKRTKKSGGGCTLL